MNKTGKRRGQRSGDRGGQAPKRRELKFTDGGIFEGLFPGVGTGVLQGLIWIAVLLFAKWMVWIATEVDYIGRWIGDLGLRLPLLLWVAGVGLAYAVGLHYYAWLKNKPPRLMLEEFNKEGLRAVWQLGKSTALGMLIAGAVTLPMMLVRGNSPPLHTVALVGIVVGMVGRLWSSFRPSLAAIDGFAAWVTYLPGVPPVYLQGWSGVLLKKEYPVNPQRVQAVTLVTALAVFTVALPMFAAETPFAAAFDAVVLACGVLAGFMVLIVTPAARELGVVYSETQAEEFRDAADTVFDSTLPEDEGAFAFGERPNIH